MNLDFTRAFVVVAIASAIGGWAVIEGLLWIVHHVSWSWS